MSASHVDGEHQKKLLWMLCYKNYLINYISILLFIQLAMAQFRLTLDKRGLSLKLENCGGIYVLQNSLIVLEI